MAWNHNPRVGQAPGAAEYICSGIFISAPNKMRNEPKAKQLGQNATIIFGTWLGSDVSSR